MYLLFDVGGTNTRVGVSKSLNESLSSNIIEKTPEDFEGGLKLIKKSAEKLVGDEKIEGVAGGLAGPLNRERTEMVNSPNRPEWVGKPIKERLQNIFEAPVFLENDTALAALAENVWGAGKDYRIVAYVNIGTGIGGTKIENGSIDESVFGFEVGQQFVDISGNNKAEKSKPLTLEEMISGSAIEKKEGKKPYEIENLSFWREEARIFAYGLNNTIVHWSPDALILGGSMIMKKPGISIDEVREYLSRIVTIYPKIPEIKLAEIDGSQRGIWGAMRYLRENLDF